ncbi:MAG TPA: hypothetical protein VIF14_02180 [Alphaproteobacteria bacterium]
MIVWSVVLPIVGTVAMLVLLGVGIARARGLREVLLGIRGKGKVSLLNLFSVEGAGLVLILAIFVGGGIVYPLANAASLSSLERLTRDVDRLRAQTQALRDKVSGWQIQGTIEIPEALQSDLEKRGLDVTIIPRVVLTEPPSGNKASFTIQVPVKRGASGDPAPAVDKLYVQYQGYKTLQIEIPPDAFRDRVIRIANKLERLPATPDTSVATRPEIPETSWEVRR